VSPSVARTGTIADLGSGNAELRIEPTLEVLQRAGGAMLPLIAALLVAGIL